MLENIVETKATMQAACVEEILCKEATFGNEMTFNNREMCPEEVKNEPVVEDSYVPSGNPTKYDDINLEDDIEKVEVTSQESSDDNDDGFSNYETPKSEVEQPTFSGIPTQSPNESIKTWLQRITDMQNEIQRKYNVSMSCQSNVTAVASSSPSNHSTTNSHPSRVIKYQDLPYMGEMTLDNSKPRRGRKPKKADICHLIYKNYGTIFPGTPNPGSYLEKDTSNIIKKSTVSDNKDPNDSVNRSDVQNRIISSLLEKRLTQEYKRTKDNRKSSLKNKTDQNEPLNLCIRDLNHLKIRLLKNTDNTYTSEEVKSEAQSDDDVELVQESSSPSSIPFEARFPVSVTPSVPSSTPSPEPAGRPALEFPPTATPGGYVYWPAAGVFIHPAALQQQLMLYQRMTQGAGEYPPLLPPSAGGLSPKPPPEEPRKIMPKAIKPKISKENTEETDIQNPSIAQEMKKRNAPSTDNSKAPTKRKRSAIFIPPIPTENNANPATEVSICKFKFTGGAKPSLQEKKMLSVDSGGNFRYYSGTGDKSMRGYEFFPRETLQQQIHNTHGSSTGAFLQASGEKIYPTPPIDFTGAKSSQEFMLNSDIAVPTNFPKSHDLTTQRAKKRKSRKSLQREKLEQTFKEKGFLIQTQQTESAEGATYCKFRQLRKFTRYLFRSWKDYLPGNIADGDQLSGGKNESELVFSEVSRDNADNLSAHSSDLSANNV